MAIGNGVPEAQDGQGWWSREWWFQRRHAFTEALTTFRDLAFPARTFLFLSSRRDGRPRAMWTLLLAMDEPCLCALEDLASVRPLSHRVRRGHDQKRKPCVSRSRRRSVSRVAKKSKVIPARPSGRTVCLTSRSGKPSAPGGWLTGLSSTDVTVCVAVEYFARRPVFYRAGSVLGLASGRVSLPVPTTHQFLTTSRISRTELAT